MNRKYNKSNANSKKTKADQITVTFRTCGNTGNMNAAKVTLLLAFTPTSAGLGTQFASLANYIAMYELFRIESSTFRVMPRPLVTGVLPPWIIGYVPFGGNAPTDFTSFENYKQSTLTPGYQIGAAFADAYPTKSNMATLQLSRADFTILEGGGPDGSFIATNSIGTQTNLGSVYAATGVNSAAVAQTFDTQLDITCTFRDLYDPTALLQRLREEVGLHTDALVTPSGEESLDDRVKRLLKEASTLKGT